MSDEYLDLQAVQREILRDEYEAKIRRLRENSWFFAFVGLVTVPLLWGIAETVSKNPKSAVIGGSIVAGFFGIRQLIVWVGTRQIKTRYATRMMTE